MDFNSLRDTVSNLSLYDIKAGVRKVQNAVMNFTEMEAKVREATNNEPWGASSSLMQEIANGTFSYQTLNEIMPMIYRRFTEKSAEEWRQIYKALQLLEFLIKHGSERVIDDARSHLTLIKMLRQFHYIDGNGKDQGVNVRNRAKELAELLSDVDRIRAERKKARATKNKYVGVEGGAGLSFGGSSSGRFGGFGSESMGSGGGGSGRDYGGFSGGVYGDGGGFGGEPNDWREGGGRKDEFEEYDEFDDDERSPPKPAAQSPAAAPAKKAAEPPKPKAPEVDLFSFDDPIPVTSSLPAPASAGLGGLSSAPADDDDEFDDFQSATPAAQATKPAAQITKPAAQVTKPMAAPPTATATTFAAPKPVSAPQKANLAEMVNLSSISPAPSSSNTPGPNYSAFSMPAAAPAPAPAPAQPQRQQPTLTSFRPSGPNYFQSVSSIQSPPANVSRGAPSDMSTGSASASASPLTMSSIKPATKTSAPGPAAAGGDAFGALWASVGTKKPNTTVTGGQTMGQLAKEKSSAGIWGAPSTVPLPTGAGGSASGDLLG